MKSVIINPFTPIPKSEKSHVRGWAIMWAQRLDADIATKDTNLDDYDIIHIDHGVNFSGALNLFGGFTDEIVDRLQNLIDVVSSGATLVSLDRRMLDCNYINQIHKRMGAKTTSAKLNDKFLSDLSECFSKSSFLPMEYSSCTNLILGDSHSLAYSLPDQAVLKTNGLTLYSVLNRGLIKYLKPHVQLYTKNVTLCLGSIDIRFHVFGEKNKLNPREYASIYASHVKDAIEHYKIPFKVCAPVPIEHEDRRMPKTGQYKGVNFNGSRQDRLDYTLEFIDRLEDYFLDFDIVIPPKHWYDMEGEQYAKEIMEMSSSVHIAPENYRSILKWEDN